MTRMISIVGGCLLAVLITVTLNVRTNTPDVGSVAESAVGSLVRPFWPVAHGKCLNLGKFDPTCPRCL